MGRLLPRRLARVRLALLTALVLASAAALAWALPVSSALAAGSSPSVFVNEIHYDNVGEDQDEGVEVAGPAGTDLSSYSLELYSGYDQKRYATIPLAGSLRDQENGFGTKFFPIPGLQNGAPDGIALIGPEGVEQTLGYEGTFTAIDGSAAGLVFADIEQFEAPSTRVGQSLQLQGHGSKPEDFSWHGPIAATPHEVNTDQHFGEAAPAPENTSAPTISGNGIDGETQYCNAGSWENDPTGYSYEWTLDGSTPVGYSESLTVEGWPSGSSLTCSVTASNSAGSSAASSSAIEIVAAPVNSSAPTISGSGAIGETQHCNQGSWEGNPASYGYEWVLDGWLPVGFSEDLVVEGWSTGDTLTCTVTASNAAGSSSARSAAVEVPAEETSEEPEVEEEVKEPEEEAAEAEALTAPLNTSLPVISGTPAPNEALSCSNGSWENNPTSIAYQWSRDGAPLAEATSSTYTARQADVGHTLTCIVTAANSAGPTSASSAIVEVGETVFASVERPLRKPRAKPGAPSGWGSPEAGGEVELYAPVVAMSRAQIESLLLRQLSAARPRAGRLLRYGGLSIYFGIPEPATLVVRWYRHHQSAQFGAASSPVLVASGRVRLERAGAALVEVKLTTAGRGLLKHASRLSLMVSATLTPAHAPAITASRSLSLRRGR